MPRFRIILIPAIRLSGLDWDRSGLPTQSVFFHHRVCFRLRWQVSTENWNHGAESNRHTILSAAGDHPIAAHLLALQWHTAVIRPWYKMADYCELAACRGVSFNFTLNLLSCGGVVAISAGRLRQPTRRTNPCAGSYQPETGIEPVSPP